MSLDDFMAQLDALATEAEGAFANAQDQESLEAARVAFLGAKSGRLKVLQKQMGGVPPEQRRTAGQKLNEVKKRIETALVQANERLKTGAVAGGVESLDPTLPGNPLQVGRLHPITQTINELVDIMGRLGFTPAEGPEIEDEWHNFEALNIPPEHPARDPLDNFYLATAGKSSVQLSAAAGRGPGEPTVELEAGRPVDDRRVLLLRSQTSTVQIRVMEQIEPPIRIISLGRVYRPDTADATHYPMFHQMEGLLIDRTVTMADLKSVLRLFATSYLGADVHVRFRPSFFPFTEPSVEADFQWNGEWIEFGGAGMVDPNVLTAVGYDPEMVTGFAFGLGVERLCMRRHGVTDIREFYKNDVRFLQQF